MQKKIVRKMSSENVEDVNSVNNIEYNEASGAQKQLEVGPDLRPICSSGNTFITDLTTLTNVGRGRSLAIYNNSGTLGSVTLGKDSSTLLLAAGVVSGDNAGIPVMPNAWTYVAVYDRPWVVTSAATMLCYLINDTTYVTDQNNPTI